MVPVRKSLEPKVKLSLVGGAREWAGGVKVGRTGRGSGLGLSGAGVGGSIRTETAIAPKITEITNKRRHSKLSANE